LFFFHLLVQAMLAGSVVLLLLEVSLFHPFTSRIYGEVSIQAIVWLVLHLGMILGEVLGPHATEDARLAVRTLIRGKWSASFWVLVVGFGAMVPLMLLIIDNDSPHRLALLASVLTLSGLWFWDDLWVKAGQSVQLS